MFSHEVLSDEACVAASEAAEIEFAAAIECALYNEANAQFGVLAAKERKLFRKTREGKWNWQSVCETL